MRIIYGYTKLTKLAYLLLQSYYHTNEGIILNNNTYLRT